MNCAPAKFLQKIPNMDVMIEFFTTKGKYYCINLFNLFNHILGPPKRDMSAQFVKDILSGEKALLKIKDVLFVKNVPHWEEFTANQVM